MLKSCPGAWHILSVASPLSVLNATRLEGGIFDLPLCGNHHRAVSQSHSPWDCPSDPTLL